MNTSYEAIVVGAGIIGACTAFELAKRGCRTLNIDKLPAAGYGSTGSSCAVIRTHYSTREGTAMAYEGLHHWRDWAGYLGTADERGLAAYRNVGCLVFKTENNGGLRQICRIMDEIGIRWEDWDLDQVAERLPYYDMSRFAPPKTFEDPAFGKPSGGRIEGAVFFPDAGYVGDPQLAAHNAQRAAESRGADFRFNAAVAEIRTRNSRVRGVTLADGTAIDAPVVVNAAGPHSSAINRLAGVEAGMTIRTRALRQEVVHLPSPPGIDFEGDGCVVSDDDIGCYSRPEIGNHILVGSQDPACDGHDWIDDADHFSRDLSDQTKVQAYRLAQRIPTLGIPNRLQGVVDLYDVSDDWIPVYDKSDLPGFYMAVGTSGNQFKNGPVAGAVMAELIERCEAGRDHDADPVAFTGRYTGQVIDLGFFSRRRPVNRASSFTVLG